MPIFQINRKCSKLKIFCPVIWWLNTEGAQISQIFIAFNTWTMANHQLKSPNTPKCQISSNSLRSRASNISRLVLSVLSSWARAAEWFVLLRLYLCFAIISSCCANYSWAESLSNVVEIFMFRARVSAGTIFKSIKTNLTRVRGINWTGLSVSLQLKYWA